MRIGIVGGGISGLACAWVLEGQHEVTLFESEPSLGGHARTIEVPVDGSTALVETGFEFFFSSLWPTFDRLLEALGVEVRDYPCRIVIHRKGSSRSSRVHIASKRLGASHLGSAKPTAPGVWLDSTGSDALY